MSTQVDELGSSRFPRGEALTQLRQLIRSFVDREIIPLEAQFRGLEHYPDDVEAHLEQKVKEMGLWGIQEPVEDGGADLGFLAQTIVTEEYARSIAHSARGGRQIFGPNAGILRHCVGEQRERFLEPVLQAKKRSAFALTEPDSGSDIVGKMTTRAVRKGDEWILSGAKMFITGADRADFFQVVALTDATEDRRKSITCFLVDRNLPGVTISREIPLMIPDKVFELSFDEVHLDDSCILGEIGHGMDLALEWLSKGRLRHAINCVGRATRALEVAIDFTKSRVTFGKPLSERQAIQFMIADCALDLYAARKAIYSLADRIDNGEDPRSEVSIAKILADEGSFRVADRSLQMLGAMGLSTDLPVELIFRELRSLRITEGTTEIHRWRTSRSILVDGKFDEMIGQKL